MNKLQLLKFKKKFFSIVGWGLVGLAIFMDILMIICYITDSKMREGTSVGLFLGILVVLLIFGAAIGWQFGFKKAINIESEIVHYEAVVKLANN